MGGTSGEILHGKLLGHAGVQAKLIMSNGGRYVPNSRKAVVQWHFQSVGRLMSSLVAMGPSRCSTLSGLLSPSAGYRLETPVAVHGGWPLWLLLVLGVSGSGRKLAATKTHAKQLHYCSCCRSIDESTRAMR